LLTIGVHARALEIRFGFARVAGQRNGATMGDFLEGARYEVSVIRVVFDNEKVQAVSGKAGLSFHLGKRIGSFLFILVLWSPFCKRQRDKTPAREQGKAGGRSELFS